MLPDAQLPRLLRRNGSPSATPFLPWKHRRAAEPVAPPLSTRNLAASLWRQLAAGGSVIRWQCGGLSSDRLGFQLCSSLEGATKWDCANHLQSNVKLITPAAFAGEAELFKSQKHVNEVEADGGRSRTKIKYRTRKINQERASSMTTEQQKMCSLIKNLAKNVKKERKICKNIDTMNSNMLRDIAEAKLSARKFILNLEDEKKAREELDCVCYDLVREIEARKAEIGALRNQQKRIQLAVDEERKMLQLAEVWREEQTQMKLADAKFILEDKYAEIRDLITHLRAFFRGLKSTEGVNEASKAEVLRQAFELINIQDGKDFKFLNPESHSRFTVIKDSQTKEVERRHDEAHCASSVTETRADESRTTYMSNCNAESNRNSRQKSEGSEICSISSMQPKPKSEGSSCKTMLINGSSNRSVSVSRAGRNPHVVRAMKGHIEWPWRIRRDDLAGNLLEAKLENQKMLVRNVLNQKM